MWDQGRRCRKQRRVQSKNSDKLRNEIAAKEKTTCKIKLIRELIAEGTREKKQRSNLHKYCIYLFKMNVHIPGP